MDVRQYEAFRAVMEYGSLSRAATALGITQPAMSGLISRLEKHVGFPLFLRDKRRLIPTAEARHLYTEVVQALSGLSRLSSAVRDIGQARRGILSLAAHPTASISWLPILVSKFQVERPGVYVRILTKSSQLLRDTTPANSFDIGIAQVPIEVPNVRVQNYRLRCLAALPVGHALASADVITPHLLTNVPFITLTRWNPMFRRVGRAFNAANARWNIVAECEFFATALNLVREGAGVSIIEPVCAEGYAESRGVILKPFMPEINYEVAVYYSSEQPLSLIAADFLQIFDDCMGAYVSTSSSPLRMAANTSRGT